MIGRRRKRAEARAPSGEGEGAAGAGGWIVGREAEGISGADGEGIVGEDVGGCPGDGVVLGGITILEGTGEDGGICGIERHTGKEKIIDGAGCGKGDVFCGGWGVSQLHGRKQAAAALDVGG